MKRYMRMRMASRPQVYDQLQDQREDTFSKVKTQLQLVNDLHDVLEQTGDSNIEFQYESAVNDLKKSMNELQQAGMSMSDLYSRFGKDILKAQVLKSRSDISEIEAKQGEQHLVDMVNEDEIIARSNLNEQIDGRVQLINELQRQGYNVTSMRSDQVQRLNARIAGLANASQQQQNLRRGFQAAGQRFRGDGGGGPAGGGPGAPGGRPGLMPARVDPAQVAIPLHGQAIPLGPAPPQPIGPGPLQFQLQRQASFAQAAGRARVQGRPRLLSDVLVQDLPRQQERDMAIVRQALVNRPIPRSRKLRRLREWEQQGFSRDVLDWYNQNQQEYDDEVEEEVKQQDFSEAPFRGQAAPYDLNMASAEAPLHHRVPLSQPVRPGHAEHRQAQISQIQQDIGRDLFQSMIQATQQQIGETRRQYLRRLEEEAARQQAEEATRQQAEAREESKQPLEEEKLPDLEMQEKIVRAVRVIDPIPQSAFQKNIAEWEQRGFDKRIIDWYKEFQLNYPDDEPADSELRRKLELLAQQEKDQRERVKVSSAQGQAIPGPFMDIEAAQRLSQAVQNLKGEKLVQAQSEKGLTIQSKGGQKWNIKTFQRKQ